MTQYVIYKRLSKEKKNGEQYGFDSQQADLVQFLNSHPGEILGEFGEFFSGKGDWIKRPELVNAVKLCQETGAILLVSKLDRLGRNVASVAKLLEMIPVKIATMPSATNMVIQILASVAEEEARAIGARTKAALAQAKAKGRLIGAAVHKNAGRKGLKFKPSIDSNYTEDLVLEVIRKNSEASFSQLAKELNDKGITTKQGKQFQSMTIKRLVDKFNI